MKNFKKIIFSILLLIMVFLFFRNTTIGKEFTSNISELTNKVSDLQDFISSGKLINGNSLDSLEDSGIDYTTYVVDEETSFYYTLLSDKEKDLYKQIYANADNLKKTFIPKESVTKNELNDAIIAVYNDSPELFWIDTSYSYKYLISGKIAQVTLNYNSTTDDIETSKYLFNYAANKIIDNVSNLSTDYEKEKYVHDYIIENVSYDASEQLNQSAYSALVTGKTVCAGYSRAFQYIMNKIGITTYYATGTSENQDHAWNIIKLDDGYYNVDLTWDDTGGISYTYFNKTDKEFNNTHTRSKKSESLPSCVATKYKYKKQFINNSTNKYDEDYINNELKKYQNKLNKKNSYNVEKNTQNQTDENLDNQNSSSNTSQGNTTTDNSAKYENNNYQETNENDNLDTDSNSNNNINMYEP